MLKNPIAARIRFRSSAITQLGVIATLLGFAAYEYGAQGDPVGPDAVARVGGEPIQVYGCLNGTQAYTAGGGVCNLGDAVLPGTDADINSNHPMWTQNLYRLADNRFEQIGMSWLKHDDWSIELGNCVGTTSHVNCGFASDTCDACANPPSGLCPGCRDVYTACQNGFQTPSYGYNYLGPRSQINPTNGEWPTVEGGPVRACDAASSGGVIACRLQVKGLDLAPGEPGSPPKQYFLEQQILTPDEMSEATRNNNVSYKAVTVGTCDPNLCTQSVCGEDRSCTGDACSCGLYPLTFPVGEPSFCQEPAIRAWKDNDPNVMETDIADQNGGKFILAAKAKKLDETCTVDCWWSYEYALYNMNSDRSAGGFRVALPAGLFPPDVRFPIIPADRFHDIAYHSGDENQFDGIDWEPSIPTGEVRWKTAGNSTNALRWGTLYNFRFEAKRAPACASTVTIDLFKTGTPSSIKAASLVPGCGGLAAPLDASVNPKNRFLSIIPTTCPTVSTAIRVTMVDLQHPIPPNIPQFPPPNLTTFDTKLDGVCVGGSLVGHHCHFKPVNYCSGGGTCSSLAACTGDPFCTNPAECTLPSNSCARWVGKPGTFLESQDSPAIGNFRAARLQCTPYYYDWGGESVVHFTGAEIVPSSTYDVQVFAASCNGNEANCADVSCPLTITTARSGDVAANFNPPSTTTQPDVIDVTTVVNKINNVPGSPSKTQTQLQPNLPELNADISVLDIVAVVDAVNQYAYAFSGPCACPSAVTCGSTACSSTTLCVKTFGAGAMCVKTCTTGVNAGQPCINDTHCNYCSGGTNPGRPCNPALTDPCPGGGVCGSRVCSTGNVGAPCALKEDCLPADGTCESGICKDVGGNTCGSCPFSGQPCSCSFGACGGITTSTCGPAFCRDRCGRCNP